MTRWSEGFPTETPGRCRFDPAGDASETVGVRLEQLSRLARVTWVEPPPWVGEQARHWWMQTREGAERNREGTCRARWSGSWPWVAIVIMLTLTGLLVALVGVILCLPQLVGGSERSLSSVGGSIVLSLLMGLGAYATNLVCARATAVEDRHVDGTQMTVPGGIHRDELVRGLRLSTGGPGDPAAPGDRLWTLERLEIAEAHYWISMFSAAPLKERVTRCEGIVDLYRLLEDAAASPTDEQVSAAIRDGMLAVGCGLCTEEELDAALLQFADEGTAESLVAVKKLSRGPDESARSAAQEVLEEAYVHDRISFATFEVRLHRVFTAKGPDALDGALEGLVDQTQQFNEWHQVALPGRYSSSVTHKFPR